MAQADPQAVDSKTEERDQDVKKWGQEQAIKVQKHCLSNGIQIKGFKTDKCMSIPPTIAIWYAVSPKQGEDYWAVSGEFPTDVAPASVAKDQRDALRYFSMSWQLKAARMEDALAEGKVQFGDEETQRKIIKDLVEKAENLWALHREERLWANTGLKIQQ